MLLRPSLHHVSCKRILQFSVMAWFALIGVSGGNHRVTSMNYSFFSNFYQLDTPPCAISVYLCILWELSHQQVIFCLFSRFSLFICNVPISWDVSCPCMVILSHNVLCKRSCTSEETVKPCYALLCGLETPGSPFLGGSSNTLLPKSFHHRPFEIAGINTYLITPTSA